MKKYINKVAVLGSGVMGSRLACHFANAGLEVLLLDIITPGLEEGKKEDQAARNKLVNESLQKAIKSNPSPLFRKSLAKHISTGNFEDDMEGIKACEWVLEAVVENLKIKKEVFDQVEKYRKAGTFISSNTSGIPIEMMLEGRSEDFQKYFLGTHFFNPPRYLRLLEIIPSSKTDPEVVDHFMHFGDLILGKRTVRCKDTPAFIANRVGVFSIMAIFKLMEELDLTIDEVDSLTGPLTGRPKSATFRTSDVVGIDTLVKVARGVYEHCPEDEERETFKIPGFLEKMVEKGWTGEKAGQGFYKKVKDDEGKSRILTLDLKDFEYKPRQKPRFGSVAQVKPIENLRERLVALSKQSDKGAKFLRLLGFNIFKYVSHRIPGTADHIFQIDDALKAGFGWKIGPFEHWDLLGVSGTVKQMKEEGFEPASWVKEMIENGIESFYSVEDRVRKYYDPEQEAFEPIPGREELILLENYRPDTPVWSNSGATLHNIGEDVLCLEFHTKMNTMGGEVLDAIQKSIDIAEKDWKGLVIANEGDNFSAGANLGMIFMLAVEQEFDELDWAVRRFQNTMMKCRYSNIPVVVSPHNLALGGGCELTMHSDAALASAETYIGLVEVGVGLIPAGGGTKETVMRISDSYYEGDPHTPVLQERFINIATAKVATSAMEAFDLHILDHKKDQVIMNADRRIAEARDKVIELADNGYVKPVERDDIFVLGRSALGMLYAGSASFELANYASEHDRKIADKLAFVMCGGDLSAPSHVSERYLLDLEREAFLSLLGEKKTLERIEAVLKTGKAVRN